MMKTLPNVDRTYSLLMQEEKQRVSLLGSGSSFAETILFAKIILILMC